MSENSVVLSRDPFVVLVRVGLTLAHVWFDRNAIDLTWDDVANLAYETSWHSDGKVILQPDEAHNGVFQLLIAPNYAEDYPDDFQQILDYMKLMLRAACPSCADYQPDRSRLELPLEPEFDPCNIT